MADAKTPSRAARILPSEAVVARLKEIATVSADTLLLPDGPPSPDWRLLDLCADALHHIKHSTGELNDHLDIIHARRPDSRLLSLRERHERGKGSWQRHREHESSALRLMRAARKIKATTPAGIYAKALLVRSSVGAAVLAQSLAEELIDCEGLRATLWPAAAEPVAG